MDSMLGENKNIKDTSKDSTKDITFRPLLGKDITGRNSLSYTKTDKLITALYMVTDTMDKDEPIRLKLRTLGVEILSDMNLSKPIFDDVERKISGILSFLNISSGLQMISEMNCNILRKEFTELKESILESKTQNHLWLEEFIKTPSSEVQTFSTEKVRPPLSFSKGHPTRIGVQKGSTLMKALSNVKSGSVHQFSNNDFERLKKERRESILKIIKSKPNGTSIKDIILAFHNLNENIGEKTLQRELISLVKDNVLKKTGEKRWSQYSIN